MRVRKSSGGTVTLEVTKAESRDIAKGYLVRPDGSIMISLTDSFAAELVRGLLEVARELNDVDDPSSDPQGAL